MPRRAIACLRILWSLHRWLRCYKTDHTIFLSLDTQYIESGQLHAPGTAENPVRLLTASICRVIASENLYLHLTESTRRHLL